MFSEDYTFRSVSKNYSLKPKTKIFLPMFYYRNFIILLLKFRSVIHFDFIFGNDVN